MGINRHWFNITATKFDCIFPPTDDTNVDKDKKKDWSLDAIPWSKDKQEAFQGQHSEYMLNVFDEASAIDDVIWEAIRGSLGISTDGYWVVAGNPTRNRGEFYDCFHKNSAVWKNYRIDARQVRRTNKSEH